MRQTIKEIEVNMAYRWFLGLELYDPVPHFSTFGKNYTRRFKDTDLFEQIFQHILEECYRFKLVDPTEIFVDATHVKARANNKKMQRRIAQQEALFYADMLRKDINADRESHGKKPLKDKDDHNKPGSGGNDKFENYTDDIPLDNAILKEQLFFLRNRLWNLPAGESRQKFPEAVLRMAVIKLLLPGFHRGKGPENQNPGIFVINRLKCMGYFFICFHRFFLFYRSEARPSAKASRRCRSSGPIFSKRLISSS